MASGEIADARRRRPLLVRITPPSDEVTDLGSKPSLPTAFQDFDFADGHFGLVDVWTGEMQAVGRPGPESNDL